MPPVGQASCDVAGDLQAAISDLPGATPHSNPHVKDDHTCLEWIQVSSGNEVALTAQVDQLRTALREVLRLMDSRGIGVLCEKCGAPVNRSCFDDGPMAEPHDVRVERSKDEARRILLVSLGRKGADGRSKPG